MADTVLVNFNNSTDFTNNFALKQGTVPTYNSNGYLQDNNTVVAALFNQPNNTSDITLKADFAQGTNIGGFTSRGVGFFVGSGTNSTSGGFAGIFRLGNGSSTGNVAIEFRLWADVGVSSTSLGTVYDTVSLLSGTSLQNLAANTFLTYQMDVQYIDPTHLDFDVSVWNGSVQLGNTVTINYVGALAQSYYDNAQNQTIYSGFRLGATGGGASDLFDNFSVSGIAAIPEPATYTLLFVGFGILLMTAVRRRNTVKV